MVEKVTPIKLRKDVENAPKDGALILADFGYGTVCASWSGADNAWSTAQLSIFELGRGEYRESYFENEWFEHGELKAWRPLL